MEFLTTENRDTALFSITAWSLWNRRNNLRLGKATVVLSQVLKQSKERMLEFSQHPNHTPPSSVILATCWRPPDKSLFKVYFDGALFCQEKRAGIGMVIRNKAGSDIAFLSQQICLPSTVLEVETLAARRAFEFAIEIGVNKVILEGDCEILIKVLQCNSYSLAQFGHLAEDVKYLASKFQCYNLSHVRRHCNVVAYTLARKVILNPYLLVWMEDVPPNVLFVLQADLEGLS